jgi:hypothetical protein
MSVRIYRWRKPELTATLTSGGSLAANTTYYLTGVFHRNWIYDSAFGPMADVISFTTTDVNKSISLYWKVTVDIQGFEDAGSGKIRVKATNHCLAGSNTLIIESGVYAGTYTVNTWENYNSFLIVGTFTTDYATTFRVETLHNAMNGLICYMHTTTPFSGNPTLGTWQGHSSRFSHYPWDNGYTTNNVAITTTFSLPIYGLVPQIMGTFNPPQPWSKVMEKGKIEIACSGTSTLAEIKQELINADVIDIGFVQGSTFIFYGILRSTGTLNFSNANITCYWGMIGSNSGYNQITYNKCNVQQLEHHYGSYLRATATNSNFLFESKGQYTHNVGSVYQTPIGTSNVFNATSLGSESLQNVSFVNMTLNSNNSSWLINGGNKTTLYKNCTINNGVLQLYYLNMVPDGTWRLLDGFNINSHTTYDMYITNVNQASYFEFVNINTNRANNVKVIACDTLPAYLYAIPIHFYRKGIINVVDENGSTLSDSIVTMKDGTGTLYTYTSDVNGVVNYEVKEQFSTKPTSGSTYINTIYSDWLITIYKTGYEKYTEKVTYLSSLAVVKTVALKTDGYGDTTIYNSTLIDTNLY